MIKETRGDVGGGVSAKIILLRCHRLDLVMCPNYSIRPLMIGYRVLFLLHWRPYLIVITVR